jgi:photosystem II stability/assembly factor-like uncharacterized protein
MRELLLGAMDPPGPGLPDRVLAAVHDRSLQRREARPHWAFALVAFVLAGALVLTLAYGSRAVHRANVTAGAAGGAGTVAGAEVRAFPAGGSTGWLAMRSTAGRTTLISTGDGGRTWTERLRYDGALPTQVLVDPDGTGVVVAAPGDPAAAELLLFRTADGGATWQQIGHPPIAAAWGLPYFADAHDGWVLVSHGPSSAGIATTADAGLHWTESPDFNDRANFPGLSSVGLRILWTAAGHGVAVPPSGSGATAVHVVVTTDGGATWRPTFPEAPRGLGVTAGNALLTAGLTADGHGALFVRRSDGQGPGEPALYAYATADGGASWGRPIRLDGPASSPAPRALFALDERHWWASSGTGADVVVTGDAGATVTRHRGLLPRGYVFRSFAFASPGDGWAVATAGGRSALFATHDGGASWQAVGLPQAP